jgi:3-isopropylmalate/(R)-2-methylmalate dehydratase small subunit
MKIITVTGQAVVIPGDDIDTDRIVPARFLKEITFEKMGNYLFYDERFHADGSPKAFPLNSVDHLDASILVVGSNFGCGSSREHAPQAIMRYGFKAIVGVSFSDIFSGNCQAIGIPCIPVSQSDIGAIMDAVATFTLTLDLGNQQIQAGDQTWSSQLSPARQQAFVTGEWNIKGILKANADQTRAVAKRLPYTQNFNI